MPMNFNKQEVVAFDQALEGFEDALTISKAFKKQSFDGTEAERSGNTFWRPMPYVAQSFDGIDQSANFNRNYTQLSVPATLGYSKSVPLTLTATELRDQLQEQRLGKAAMQRLASDINVSCSNIAALSGTIVVKRNAAPSGFDDIAAADYALNRVGIDTAGRKAFLPSNHYNAMASNLAGRQTLNGKTLTAYEKAAVGEIAGFDLRKLDYGYRLAAATATGVTVNGAAQGYVPKSTSIAATGEQSNVDNRYQNLTVTVTGSTIKVGDAFTIAGVNEVHHITKQDTGELKTFRVTGIVSGGGASGVVQISPPIIAGASDAEKQYQNVTAVPANGAAITFLNTTAGAVCPFWQEEAYEIIPGKYMPKEESGLAVMSATTDNGLTVTMTRQGDIGSLNTKYRWDVWYGLCNLQPQMSGIIIFP